jgi:hypothetical protein
LRVVPLVLTALWLGAALFTTIVVAPSAFRVLPSRALAGEMVGALLPVLFVAGMVVGAAVATIEVAGVRGKRWLFSAAGALLLTLGCGIAHFAVAPRIAQVRQAAGVSMESLPPDSDLRAEFGRLHAMSVIWLGVAASGAVSVCVLSFLRMRAGADDLAD